MSQAGYTPIQLYFSTTAAAVPVNTNLANGELAINITDGKLYYKDNGGTVRLLASNATSAPVLSFQTSLGGLTPSTATTGVVTLAGTLNTTSGGTGLTSFTAGDVPYYASGSVLSKLAIGTAGQFLTSTGTAPQWSTLSGVAVTTFSAGTTGFTPSSATAGAVTLAGTLATTNGGTGRTSFTSGGVVYASSSSALATGSVLNFDGSNLSLVEANGSGAKSILMQGGATGGDYGIISVANGSTIRGRIVADASSDVFRFDTAGGASTAYTWLIGASYSEGMRLTSTGLGIGTTSPTSKFVVSNAGGAGLEVNPTGVASSPAIISYNRSGAAYTQLTNLALQHVWQNSGTEAMRLDSAGNLGLGVTPSAWLSTLQAIQVKGVNGIYGAGSSELGLTQNAFYNASSQWIYGTTNAAGAYQISTGVHKWLTAASGTAGNPISFTQAMTLDASGNLGVGTTSPQTRLDVFQANAKSATGIWQVQVFDSTSQTTGVGGGISFSGYKTAQSSLEIFAGIDAYKENSTGGNAAGALRFHTQPSAGTGLVERFRIASTGAFGLSGANYGTSGQVLTSGGSGAAPTWTTVSGGSSQWTTSGSNIYYNTGNVGIGSANTPSSKLDISGFASTNLTGIALAITDAPSVANAGLQIAFRNSSTTYSYASIGYSNEAGASAGALLFYTNPSVFANTNTERMRIDSAGRVGINTTAATTNIARLMVNGDPSTDRYGIYVPGGNYVGVGPSGANYGGYFVPNVSNSTGTHVGVYGSAGVAAVGSAQYGGYFVGGSSASTPNHGIYAIGNQSDNNGPAQAFGGYFVVTTSNPSPAAGGGMIPVRAESQANKGGFTYAVWASTLAGPTTINGYYYEHAGSLQFRVKSNGGIDNYSANNSNLSDRREKKDFAPAKSYLDAICTIPVQTFKYIDQTDDLPNLGVVAQDVQAVAPELVVESNWAKHDEEPKMRLSVYETDLVYALMKSIQELKAQFDEYKASHP